MAPFKKYMKRKVKKYIKKSNKKNLISTIKQVVAGTQETKVSRSFQVYASQQQFVNTNQLTKLIPNLVRVATPVSVGSTSVWSSADGTRVGNAVNPISCKTSVILTLTPTTFACDLFAVIYIMRIQGYDNYTDSFPSGANPPDFLDFCDGTQGLWSGSLTNIDQPVYRHTFKLIHKKVVHLKRDPGPVNGPGATGNGYGPIDTTYRRTFNIPIPKTLKYQQDEVSPNNCAPVMLIVYCHADGSPADQLGREVQVATQTVMYYKDS